MLQAADPDRRPVWPLGLRHMLPDAPTHSILAQQGPVHAVGLAQTSEGCMAYCLGHTGTLKIFNAISGSQVCGWHSLGRQMKLAKGTMPLCNGNQLCIKWDACAGASSKAHGYALHGDGTPLTCCRRRVRPANCIVRLL